MKLTTIEKKLLEKINSLARKIAGYDEQYRQKVYPKLTEEQKQKRRLRLINGKLYCDNLIKARNTFFKKEAESIIEEACQVGTTDSLPTLICESHPASMPSLQDVHRTDVS